MTRWNTPNMWLVGLFVLIIIACSLSLILLDSITTTILQYTGYGSIGIGVWVTTLCAIIFVSPSKIFRFYKVWAMTAICIPISLTVLALFNGSTGILLDASLGGKWGQILAGENLAETAIMIAAMTILLTLVINSKKASKFYLSSSISIIKMLIRSTLIVCSLLINVLHRLKPILSILISTRRKYIAGDKRRFVPNLSNPLKHIPTSTATVNNKPSSKASSYNDNVQPKRNDVQETDGTTTGSQPMKPKETESQPMKSKEEENHQPLPSSSVPTLSETLASSVREWRTPSVDLLEPDESRNVPEETLQEIAVTIENTLSEHDVQATVDNIKAGPRVIRFGLTPGWMRRLKDRRNQQDTDNNTTTEMNRVKVQSILAREKDLALALKTPQLRLEAAVPGESVVGIEVPNPFPSTVFLRTVENGPNYQQIINNGGMPVALGCNTSGNPIAVDLQDMPHLLIAGATGSGKSVCINSILASLILSCGPDKLRFLLVDPKRVELTPFNALPHLLTPVIVETDRVLKTLQGVIGEMMRRYDLLGKAGVRNIDSLRKKTGNTMPFLVIVIDELADLMISSRFEAETALVRLAQLGRATGIHLILATQRPSVNVVTGLMKANMPSRIAFGVASQIDSRVILDSAGAEKLLGKGDMLFLSSDSPHPARLQGTFVSDEEIESLVNHWTQQKGPVPPNIELTVEKEHSDSVDEPIAVEPDDNILEEAIQVALRQKHISPSILQRKLSIGYPKALELIDSLEDEGIVESGAPGKSRKVLPQD